MILATHANVCSLEQKNTQFNPVLLLYFLFWKSKKKKTPSSKLFKCEVKAPYTPLQYVEKSKA